MFRIVIQRNTNFEEPGLGHDNVTHIQQYARDDEDAENDIDTTSPAGHVFIMKYHFRNACAQQSVEHTFKNTPARIEDIYEH